MARNANELNRKVLQNLRTKKSSEVIAASLSGIAAQGEIIVQFPDEEGSVASGTSLWTLAQDGETAVQFVNKETVSKMIETGASQSVQELSAAVITEVARLDSEIDEVVDDVEELSGKTADEIARATAAEEALEDKIDAEEARAKAAESALTSSVAEEEARATAAEEALNDKIETEEARAKAAESALTSSVAEEEARATAAEEALEDKIDAETARAESAETSLAEAIQELKDASVVNEDGSITVVTGGTGGTEISVHVKSDEHVLAKDGGEGLYTNIKLSAVTPSETNVKEEFVLYGTDNTVLGDHIKIYKDSSLYRAYLGHVDDTLTSASDPTVVPGSGDTALCFIYQLADGTYELVAINVESFLEESEFADGLEVDNHVVSVKIDSTSEEFLTVGPDGLKLDGVQDAIDLAKEQAISAATIMVAEEEERATSAETKLRYDLDTLSASVDAEMNEIVTSIENLSAGTIEEDAELQRQINELKSGSTADIAELSAATVAEIARAESAETALDSVVGSVKGASESRTYSHNGTHYLDGNSTVKADAETLDSLLGVVNEGTSADTEFSSSNTVAKNISDIKKALDAFEHQSELRVVDDGQYIDAQVTVAESGTTISVEAITKDIALSTSGDSALADSYDVKQFAVSAVKDDSTGNTINVSVVTEGDVRKIDFTNMVVDCGEF